MKKLTIAERFNNLQIGDICYLFSLYSDFRFNEVHIKLDRLTPRQLQYFYEIPFENKFISATVLHEDYNEDWQPFAEEKFVKHLANPMDARLSLHNKFEKKDPSIALNIRLPFKSLVSHQFVGTTKKDGILPGNDKETRKFRFECFSMVREEV